MKILPARKRPSLMPPPGHTPLGVVKELLQRQARTILQLQSDVRRLRGRIDTLENTGTMRPDLCAAQRCGYFADYLTHGPAALTHQQYHADMDRLRGYYEICDRWHGLGENPWYRVIFTAERDLRVR